MCVCDRQSVNYKTRVIQRQIVVLHIRITLEHATHMNCLFTDYCYLSDSQFEQYLKAKCEEDTSEWFGSVFVFFFKKILV